MVAVTHYGVEGEVVENRIVDVEEISVEQGDNLVFLMTSQQVSHLRKVGNDLKIDFNDGEGINIKGFFHKTRDDVESVVTFKDTLYTQSELTACYESKGGLVIEPKDVTVIHQHESEHLLKPDGTLDGTHRTSAYAGSSFLYHFTLDEDFPESSRIQVKFDGKPMPEWMKLEKIGSHKYMISGVPEKPDVGEHNIEIKVLVPDEGEELDEKLGSDYRAPKVETVQAVDDESVDIESHESKENEDMQLSGKDRDREKQTVRDDDDSFEDFEEYDDEYDK